MLRPLLYALIIVFLTFSCSSFKSGVSIPPYQEFILGEKEEAGFKVELTNTSPYDIKIETRNAQNEKTSGFGISPKGKTKVYISANEKAVLINPNNKAVKVQAKLTRGIEGMAYQVMDLKKVNQDINIKASDLQPMLSKDWKGKLTYSDYSSGKRVDIPCNLEVTTVDPNNFKFQYIFPEEPDANSQNNAEIDEENQMFEGRKIIDYQKNNDGIIIKTVKQDMDDDKPAMLFYTYTLTDNSFSIKKEFQTMGSSELVFRNEYVFSK